MRPPSHGNRRGPSRFTVPVDVGWVAHPLVDRRRQIVVEVIATPIPRRTPTPEGEEPDEVEDEETPTEPTVFYPTPTPEPDPPR